MLCSEGYLVNIVNMIDEESVTVGHMLKNQEFNV